MYVVTKAFFFTGPWLVGDVNLPVCVIFVLAPVAVADNKAALVFCMFCVGVGLWVGVASLSNI